MEKLQDRSGLMPKMVNSVVEADIHMVIDLMNLIKVERDILA